MPGDLAASDLNPLLYSLMKVCEERRLHEASDTVCVVLRTGGQREPCLLAYHRQQ
jgi:hypothetical protein